jgi:large subunit ribosomal protein L17
MRHRMKGRKLGRNGSHRKAMFRNMAASLIKTLDQDDQDEGAAKVPGRIITTTQKAKELRPQIERLVTIARKASVIEESARELESGAEKGSDEWKQWRQSDKWNEWTQAVAPAVALRRRAYATLRDHDAVSILFSVLAERFGDRDGGYTRIVKLATPRLGDAGQRALIEFVGENDRVKRSKAKTSLAVKETEAAEVGADSSEEEAVTE